MLWKFDVNEIGSNFSPFGFISTHLENTLGSLRENSIVFTFVCFNSEKRRNQKRKVLSRTSFFGISIFCDDEETRTIYFIIVFAESNQFIIRLWSNKSEVISRGNFSSNWIQRILLLYSSMEIFCWFDKIFHTNNGVKS